MSKFLNPFVILLISLQATAAWAIGDVRPIAIRGTPPFKAELAVETDYSGKADTGFPTSRTDVSQWVNQVQALYFPEVRGNLHLRTGVVWQRSTFDSEVAEPIPGKLQTVTAVLGMDHRLSSKWDMRLEVRPGLYGDLSDVHGGTFNAPFIGGLSYFANPRLHILGGFMVDPRADLPFFPFVGFRWQYAPNWTLEFVAPKPRVRYQASESLSLYTGAEIRGGTFRVGRDFGTTVGDPRLNDDVLNVREYRVGGGAEWKITPFIILDASAGYMIERRFHYREADVNYYSGGAPYAQVSFRYRFSR